MNKFDELDNAIKQVIDGENCPSHVADFIENSVTFSAALWSLLRDHGLQSESDIPDHTVMEQVIDRVYGELAATCMILTDSNSQGNIVNILNNIANNLETLNVEAVPHQMIQGYRDLAKRLENTFELKKTLNTKQVQL